MTRTLVISDPKVSVRVVDGCFSLARGESHFSIVRPHDLEQVVILGNVGLSAGARSLLLRQGVDCVFLTGNGRYRGRLHGRDSRNILLRTQQFRQFLDPEFARILASGFAAGKVANQRRILVRAQRSLRDDALARTLGTMRLMLQTFGTEPTVDAVRGQEGRAAHLYFLHFGKLILNPAFGFSGRNRRPPLDPVNSCLSFGYALLQTVVEVILLEVGFDPYLGVLHAPEYGRPSLVLDVMEEFRPVLVDSLVLRLMNRRQLVPTDFGPPEDAEDAGDLALDPAAAGGESVSRGSVNGIYLRDRGRKVFLAAFFKRLRETQYHPGADQVLPLRQIVRQQVYLLARLLKGEATEYVAFAPRL